MNLPKYKLEVDTSFTFFEFVSEGRKGAIQKSIQFQPTEESDLYNLAFGDRDFLTSSFNDLAVSDNGDMEKVLATVVSAIFIFCANNPNASIFATGSTPSRTRLYRMGITKYYEEIVHWFDLYGQIGDDFYPFEKHTEYIGFLVKRKMI